MCVCVWGGGELWLGEEWLARESMVREGYGCVSGWVGEKPSLVPRPCAFVACSTKFSQKAWSILSHDACRSLRHDHSAGINDVIDELAHCLALKEAPRDHSNGSCVNLPLRPSAKSLGSEEHKLPYLAG